MKAIHDLFKEEISTQSIALLTVKDKIKSDPILLQESHRRVYNRIQFVGTAFVSNCRVNGSSLNCWLLAPKSNMNSEYEEIYWTRDTRCRLPARPCPPFFGGSSAHCVGITKVPRKRVSLPMFLRQVLRLFFMKTIIHTVFIALSLKEAEGDWLIEITWRHQ